jgi:hypothetical protein
MAYRKKYQAAKDTYQLHLWFPGIVYTLSIRDRCATFFEPEYLQPAHRRTGRR